MSTFILSFPSRLFNSSHSPPNWKSRPTFNKLLDIITSPGSSTTKMAFLEAIIKTQVLQEAHKFLLSKGTSNIQFMKTKLVV